MTTTTCSLYKKRRINRPQRLLVGQYEGGGIRVVPACDDRDQHLRSIIKNVLTVRSKKRALTERNLNAPPRATSVFEDKFVGMQHSKRIEYNNSLYGTYS